MSGLPRDEALGLRRYGTRVATLNDRKTNETVRLVEVRESDLDWLLAREQTERERANEFEAALKDIATYREIDVNGEYTTTEPIEGYDAYCIARKVLSAREPGEEVCEDCGHDLSLHTAGGMCSAEIKGGCHCIRMRA